MPQFSIDATGCTWVQYWMQKRYCLRTKGSSWILYCPSVFSLFVRFVVVLGAFLVLFVCRFCFVLFCFGFWFSLPVLALVWCWGSCRFVFAGALGWSAAFSGLALFFGPLCFGPGLGLSLLVFVSCAFRFLVVWFLFSCFVSGPCGLFVFLLRPITFTFS